MENEERIKIENLERRTNRLETIYIIYAGSASPENKIHWKTEWYRTLYGIGKKD